MRAWDGINRYLAFRLKELEFRVHTWRRSREISRAYDTPSTRKQRAVSADFYTLKLRVIAGAKVAGVVLVLFLLGFGVVKLASLASSASAVTVNSAAGLVDLDAVGADDSPAPIPPDMSEDAGLPEAGVLPEGYASASADTLAPAGVQPPPLPPPPSAGKLVDAFKGGIPRGISNLLVLVDKAAKVMYILRTGPDGWEVAQAFPVATGERAGRKVVEGDRKTPQGVYFIVGRKHRSELTNLYGPAAFILDYPNAQDRLERRTGHGIWIHGSERGNIPPLFTQGCVATSNPEILQFGAILGAEWIGTPVVIVSGEEEAKKHLASVDFGAMRTRRNEVITRHGERQAEFEKLVMEWKAAWESRDIERYSSFYFTSQFREGTSRWEAFRDRKSRLFNAYTAIYVDLSNIMLTEYTDNHATVKFHQVYNTNVGNRMENAKRLIFRREQGNWKIYREIPFPKEELL
jgi:murein L,D-transpeptidase YafK